MHSIMKCVVCERPNQISELVTFFESKICGACKTSFNRSLEKLHNYLERRIVERSLHKTNSQLVTDATRPHLARYEYKSQLVNVIELEKLVWEYLSNPEFCRRKSQFSPGFTCETECCDCGNSPCQHCRFRKIVIGMQQLDLGFRRSSKNSDSKLQLEIVSRVKKYSKRILKYCRFELENSIDSEKLEDASDKVQTKIKNKNSQNHEFPNSISPVKHSDPMFPDPSIRLTKSVSYESPLSRVSSQLSDLGRRDWIQPHLHNRCTKIKEDTNNGGLTDWLSGTNDSRNKGFTHDYNKMHLQFQAHGNRIFTEILSSLLITQLAETSIPFSVKTGLQNDLQQVVTSTMKYFDHLMAGLRILASENDNDQILCSPYGTTFITRTMLFQKYTILYGLANSERYLKMIVGLLERMKILTSFHLMIVYMSLFVGIIDDSVIKNTNEQIGSVIRGFRVKIESLSLKYGLNEVSELVISFAKFVKNSVDYNERDARIRWKKQPNFDVCDKF